MNHRINLRSLFLRDCAACVGDELAQHAVLRNHWSDLSVILKGSAARGNADGLSDVDMVLYGDERTRAAVISEYRAAGLTQRDDGIFMFFAGKGYDGHYNVESFNQLCGYFTKSDFIHIWEYQNVVAIHDPANRFVNSVSAWTAEVFADPLVHIKHAYLDLQLTLDWMRHPLKRGDSVSVYLHCAQLVQGFIRISYLLDSKPFPPDKWAAHYLRTTRFGKRHGAHIRDYVFESAGAQSLTRYQDLSQYPLYTQAQVLISQTGRFIQRQYGYQPWINEWYRYV